MLWQGERLFWVVLVPVESDACGDFRALRTHPWRRMRCLLVRMKWDCRSASRAKERVTNLGHSYSSGRMRRHRQPARQHTGGVYDSPCSLEVYAIDQHEQ